MHYLEVPNNIYLSYKNLHENETNRIFAKYLLVDLLGLIEITQ